MMIEEIVCHSMATHVGQKFVQTTETCVPNVQTELMGL